MDMKRDRMRGSESPKQPASAKVGQINMFIKNIRRILSEREKKVVLFSKEPLQPSAVLIPLYNKNGEYHVLLTKRTEEL